MIDLREPPDGSSGQPVSIITLTGKPLPVDAEFSPTTHNAVFVENALPFGRCFGSKSGYRAAHPRAQFLPNANIFSLRHGKLWWGDLDLTVDAPALERIARRLRCRLFVLREFEGRWLDEQIPAEDIRQRARWCTGGRGRVPGLRRYLKRAGLTARELALILGERTAKLTQPQAPAVFLELSRKLKVQEGYFAEVALSHGFKKWGTWWLSPNAFLRGKAPIDLRRADATTDLERLLQKETQHRIAQLRTQTASDADRQG